MAIDLFVSPFLLTSQGRLIVAKGKSPKSTVENEEIGFQIFSLDN
jgi:hypothetical protein